MRPCRIPACNKTCVYHPGCKISRHGSTTAHSLRPRGRASHPCRSRPGCAGRELVRSPQTRSPGHIGERAIAIVVKQMALTKGRDEDVLITVIVVITNGSAEPKKRDRQPGLARYIAEGAILIVMEELLGSDSASMPGPILTIDQQNVRISIVVVIDERAARPHGLGEIFFSERTVVVGEADARFHCDVAEGDFLSEGRRAGEHCEKKEDGKCSGSCVPGVWKHDSSSGPKQVMESR